MLRSCLYDYSHVYILVSAIVRALNIVAASSANSRKNIITKNGSLLTNFICEINKKQIDNAKHIDIVMPMYNLIEYSVWTFMALLQRLTIFKR